MFKVYKRKIHVYRAANALDGAGVAWVYCWSTNAAPTCRAAVEQAKAKCPGVAFKAAFAKD